MQEAVAVHCPSCGCQPDTDTWVCISCCVQLLQRHVQAGAAATQAGDTEAVRAHAEVVKAGLGMLVGFAEWAPLGQLGSSHVVDACAFFLQARDFQGAALAVLKQVGDQQISRCCCWSSCCVIQQL